MDVTDKEIRNPERLKVSQSRTVTYHTCFIVTAKTIWNGIPDTVVAAEMIAVFKNRVFAYLREMEE